MRMGGPSSWGIAAQNRIAYRYDHAKHKHLMGYCKWLPKDGDVCVCTGHSGDCFHNYFAMRRGNDGLWRMVGTFGAYGFGEPLGEIENRAYHLLQAGEAVALDL